MPFFIYTLMLLLIFLILSGDQTKLPFVGGLSPSRFELHPLNNVVSPADILVHDGATYLISDIGDSKPALYRLHNSKSRGFFAVPIAHFPLLDLQSIQYDAKRAMFWLSSEKRFTSDVDDWSVSFLGLEPRQFRIIERILPNIPNTCFDDARGCGVTGIYHVSDSRILAVRKHDPGKIYDLRLARGKFEEASSRTLRYRKAYANISGVRVRGGYMIFLLRDRWTLAYAPLKELLEVTGRGPIELETLFDFSHLKFKVKTSKNRITYKGLPVGFDFGENGDLLIILNNQGFPYSKTPDDVKDDRPKLLIFSAAEKEAKK